MNGKPILNLVIKVYFLILSWKNYDKNLLFSKCGFIQKINNIRLSQIITLILGTFAVLLAARMTNVLDLMLYSYAFMVSGLFIPVLGALYLKRRAPLAAFVSMILGGGTTIILIILGIIC